MKRAIITGATGMIGITLINYLLEKDIEILAIIRKNSRRKINLPNNKKSCPYMSYIIFIR